MSHEYDIDAVLNSVTSASLNSSHTMLAVPCLWKHRMLYMECARVDGAKVVNNQFLLPQ